MRVVESSSGAAASARFSLSPRKSARAGAPAGGGLGGGGSDSDDSDARGGAPLDEGDAASMLKLVSVVRIQAIARGRRGREHAMGVQELQRQPSIER